MDFSPNYISFPISLMNCTDVVCACDYLVRALIVLQLIRGATNPKVLLASQIFLFLVEAKMGRKQAGLRFFLID